MPFQKLAEQAYPPDKKDKGYRDKLRKVVNMVYVGVVAYDLRDRDGGGRGGRSAASSPAARRRPPRSTSPPPGPGYDWAEEHLPADLPYRVERIGRPRATRS